LHLVELNVWTELLDLRVHQWLHAVVQGPIEDVLAIAGQHHFVLEAHLLVGKGALPAALIVLHHLEDWLSFVLWPMRRVENQVGIQLSELFELHKPPLIPESLLSKVLPALISDELLVFPDFLFFPEFHDFFLPLFHGEGAKLTR